MEADRLEEATQLLQEFAECGFELPLDQVWLTGMVDIAEAAIECRDLTAARPLFAQLEPWADQLPATGASALGPVSHYLGGLAAVLGRHDQADAYYARAAALSAQMGAEFFVARTNLSWGRMLAERQGPDDAERARDLLTRARDTAEARGYGPWPDGPTRPWSAWPEALRGPDDGGGHTQHPTMASVTICGWRHHRSRWT